MQSWEERLTFVMQAKGVLDRNCVDVMELMVGLPWTFWVIIATALFLYLCLRVDPQGILHLGLSQSAPSRITQVAT